RRPPGRRGLSRPPGRRARRSRALQKQEDQRSSETHDVVEGTQTSHSPLIRCSAARLAWPRETGFSLVALRRWISPALPLIPPFSDGESVNLGGNCSYYFRHLASTYVNGDAT